MTIKTKETTRVTIDVNNDFLASLNVPANQSRKTALESIVQSSHSEVEFVPLNLIDANPFQPRLGMSFGDVEDLADNIYQNGLLQIPQARRTADGRVQLAFGHRRFKAYQYIYYNKFNDGYTHDRHGEFGVMPLVIKDLTDQKMYEFAASENSNRKDLNPIDVARSIMKAAELGISQQDAGKLHGYAKSAASELVQLLGLPQEIINLISDNKLSSSHGRELRRALAVVVHEPHHVVKMARDAVANELRVIDLKKAVDKFIAERTTPPPMLPMPKLSPAQVDQAVAQTIAPPSQTAPAPEPAKEPEPTASRFCPDCHHEQLIPTNDDSVQCSTCGAHNPPTAWDTTQPELKPADLQPAPMPQAPAEPEPPTTEPPPAAPPPAEIGLEDLEDDLTAAEYEMLKRILGLLDVGLTPPLFAEIRQRILEDLAQ